MIYNVHKITSRQDLDNGLTERCWTKPGDDAAFRRLGMNMSLPIGGYIVCWVVVVVRESTGTF